MLHLSPLPKALKRFICFSAEKPTTLLYQKETMLSIIKEKVDMRLRAKGLVGRGCIHPYPLSVDVCLHPHVSHRVR
jgi:hypothetical protein